MRYSPDSQPATAMLEEYRQSRAKKLSANAGLLNLLSHDGGVASTKEAAVLYGGTKPVGDDAVRKAARGGKLIFVRNPRGQMLFPRWQFSERGGVWPGIHAPLQVLRKHPHFHDLLPLTFFLNPSARLGGKRPLDLVRHGGPDTRRRVLKLAEEAGE